MLWISKRKNRADAIALSLLECEARLENLEIDFGILKHHARRQTAIINLLVSEVSTRATGLEMATINKELTATWENTE